MNHKKSNKVEKLEILVTLSNREISGKIGCPETKIRSHIFSTEQTRTTQAHSSEQRIESFLFTQINEITDIYVITCFLVCLLPGSSDGYLILSDVRPCDLVVSLFQAFYPF